jgi:chromate transporter
MIPSIIFGVQRKTQSVSQRWVILKPLIKQTLYDKHICALVESLTVNAHQNLRELVVLFLRLGVTAFGGPAAHIGMFHDEVVKRRGWLTDQRFMDLLGVTNLIPGPNSTEMAIHIGFERAGLRGLIAAGLCFILPAALIVGVLAAVYVQVGMTPAAQGLLYGVKPVVIAIVLQAIYSLLDKALKRWLLRIVAVIVFGLALLNVSEIVLIFGTGLLIPLIMRIQRWQRRDTHSVGSLTIPLLLQMGTTAVSTTPISLGTLFLTFLKIGSVLYGSGYVLLSFLRTEFVLGLGWLTEAQLLDAVAVGQFTPGPLFTTATFIGYVVLGVPGAVAATIGIFLPSFVFVWAVRPLVDRLRQSEVLSGFLDGVNAAALALMAAVTVQLAQSALIDLTTITLALIAGVMLIRFRVNSMWLIVVGGMVGLAVTLLQAAAQG